MIFQLFVFWLFLQNSRILASLGRLVYWLSIVAGSIIRLIGLGIPNDFKA